MTNVSLNISERQQNNGLPNETVVKKTMGRSYNSITISEDPKPSTIKAMLVSIAALTVVGLSGYLWGKYSNFKFDQNEPKNCQIVKGKEFCGKEMDAAKYHLDFLEILKRKTLKCPDLLSPELLHDHELIRNLKINIFRMNSKPYQDQSPYYNDCNVYNTCGEITSYLASYNDTFNACEKNIETQLIYLNTAVKVYKPKEQLPKIKAAPFVIPQPDLTRILDNKAYSERSKD